jgi:hypothetical protein
MKVGCGESMMVDEKQGKTATVNPKRSFGRKPKTRMMPRKLSRKSSRY